MKKLNQFHGKMLKILNIILKFETLFQKFWDFFLKMQNYD